MFNLPVIQSLAADTLEISVSLSPNSLTLILAMVDTLTEFWRWNGASGKADASEIDEIDAMIGALISEITTPLEVATMNELPVGSIFASANTQSSPTLNSWSLYCNGASYTRTDYPELWAALGTPFRIDDDNFHVPDLRQRFIYGSGSLPTPIGGTGGAETHTLTTTEIPAHDHAQRYNTNNTGGVVSVNNGSIDSSSSSPTNMLATAQTGGGGAHNNMPPYMILKWYIVAKPSAS